MSEKREPKPGEIWRHTLTGMVAVVVKRNFLNTHIVTEYMDAERPESPMFDVYWEPTGSEYDLDGMVKAMNAERKKEVKP